MASSRSRAVTIKRFGIASMISTACPDAVMWITARVSAMRVFVESAHNSESGIGFASFYLQIVEELAKCYTIQLE